MVDQARAETGSTIGGAPTGVAQKKRRNERLGEYALSYFRKAKSELPFESSQSWSQSSTT